MSLQKPRGPDEQLKVHMQVQSQERQHHHSRGGRNKVEKTFFMALTVTQSPTTREIALESTLAGDLWANMTVYFTVHSYGLIGQ